MEANTETSYRKAFYRVLILFIAFMFGSSIYQSCKSINDKQLMYDNKVSEILSDIKTYESVINDSLSIPTKSELKTIYEIKDMVNDDIFESNLDSITKEKVMDAIENIDVYVSDRNFNTYSSSSESAAFIRYYDLKAKEVKRFIFITTYALSDKNQLYSSLEHEIWHLVDETLGKNDNYYSTEHKISNIFDKNIISSNVNRDEFLKRISILGFDMSLRKGLLNSIKKDSIRYNKYLATRQKSSIEVSNILYDQIGYMTSNKETFVRLHLLKRWLVNKCQMNSTNDDITNEHIQYIVNYGIINLMDENSGFAQLIFYLKIDYSDVHNVKVTNIDEINRLIRL